MRQGDMPPPAPERVARSENFEKTKQYRTSDRTRKICTVPPPKTPTQKHGLTVLPKRLPTIREKGRPKR